MLLFVILCASAEAQNEVIKKYSASLLDYDCYFISEQLQAGEVNHYNLEPMLNVGICVPNCGIYRFFPSGGWQSSTSKAYTKVFQESPYQQHSSLRYQRGNWKVEKAFIASMKL